jgi:hypothetical protein
MTGQQHSLSYHDYVQGLQMLTPEEQLSLVEAILTNLKMVMRTQHKPVASKLANLTRRKLIVGDPDELVDLKVWEWNEPRNL